VDRHGADYVLAGLDGSTYDKTASAGSEFKRSEVVQTQYALLRNAA